MNAMSRLLAKDRVTTSVGVVLSLLAFQRVVSFARGIIFARALGTELYGIFTLSLFIIPIMVIVASLGVPSAFGRFVPRYEQKGAVRWFLKKTYTLTLALAIPVAAVIVLAPGTFSNLIYGEPTHTRVVTLAALCVPLMLVFRNVSSTFLGLRLFRASAVFEFFQILFYGLIGTAFILYFRSPTSGLFAYALSFLLVLALFVPTLIRYLRQLEPHYRALEEEGFYRRLLHFSIWFMVTPILAQIFHYVGRLAIQRLMTSSDQGIYSATAAIAGLLSAVGLAVNNVIYPHLSATWEAGNREEALHRLDLAIRVTSTLLLVLGLVAVLAGDFIIDLLLGEDYAPGAAVLPYQVVFYLLTVSVWLFGVFPSLIEKTYVATIGFLVALPANVVLNLTLIPRLGIIGAAVATMLSYLVMWLMVVGICRRLGLRLGARTLLVSLAPFVLLLPRFWAAAAVLVFTLVSLLTGFVFAPDEKKLATTEAMRYVRMLRSSRGAPPEPPEGPEGEGPQDLPPEAPQRPDDPQ
jgi:O-antigen/teichoic acid export membrane protein